MEWLIAGGAGLALVVAAAIAQRKGWIDLTGRHTAGRGGSGVAGLVGGVDEVFAPTRHEAQRELEREHSLPAPAPVPGDGAGRDVYSGRIRIDTSELSRD